jgi:chaperonin GroES
MSLVKEPIGSRVLIRRKEAEEKVGEIIIPDVAKEPPQEGEVVFVGPDTKQAKVGHTAFFSKYAGTEVTIDGTTLVVLREDDVMLLTYEDAF